MKIIVLLVPILLLPSCASAVEFSDDQCRVLRQMRVNTNQICRRPSSRQAAATNQRSPSAPPNQPPGKTPDPPGGKPGRGQDGAPGKPGGNTDGAPGKPGGGQDGR